MLKIDSPAFLGFTPATKQFLPFAPSEAQENDAEILKLIDERVKEI